MLQKLIYCVCLQPAVKFAKIDVMAEDLVESLKDLGFNSYEAKVYLALLKKYPATGYEVSQIADIPQSRAYDTLKSLVAAGFVFSDEEKPQKYSPISPRELTMRFKRKLNSTIEFLDKKLPEVKDDYNEPIHTVSGYDNVIDKLKEVIKNAKSSIYIVIWATDYNQLEKELAQAYDRGVSIKIVGYDNLKTVYGLVYAHAGAREIERSIGSRLIYLVADNCESVFGRIEKHVVWSKNDDIAYLLKEFVMHEMYLLDVYEHFPEQLRYFYGAGFKKLKDKISDKSSSYKAK